MKELLLLLAAAVISAGCGSIAAVTPEPDTPAEQTPESPYPTVTVTGGAVNLRQGPGTVYAVVGTVSSGDTLLVTGEAPDWYSVYIPERSIFAWIHSSLTTDAQLP